MEKTLALLDNSSDCLLGELLVLVLKYQWDMQLEQMLVYEWWMDYRQVERKDL